MWRYKPSADFDLCMNLDAKDAYQAKLRERGLAQMKTAEILLSKLENSAGMILGDEVGMGKTWIALLTAIPVAQERPVLVLTPSRVLSNQWRKQYLNLIESKLVGSGDVKAKHKSYAKQLNVYEDFSNLVVEAKRMRKGIFVCAISAVNPSQYYRSLDNAEGLFDLVILDEGHNFKNESTLKYQIFKTTRDDRTFHQPLNGKMKRMLILTATPFQLGHAELNGVLSIVEATCAEPELKAAFRKDLDDTLKQLTQYQDCLTKFEHQFRDLDQADYQLFKSSLEASEPKAETSSAKVNALLLYFGTLKAIKVRLNGLLLKFLVRNSKEKSHREEKANPISLAQDQQLLFFVTEQLGKVKRRHFPGSEGHSPAIESSYARFEDHLHTMKGLEHHSLKHYHALASDLFKDHYAKSRHPKMDTIVEQAFEAWMRSEKTLIFCFYIKTLKQFSELFEQRIGNYIEGRKKELYKGKGSDLQVFRNNIGTSANLESLVFRDNLFSVSLAPLIAKNGLDMKKFLSVGEDDLKDLVRYLEDINFNAESPNYAKLVAAFTYFAFGKFQRKHKKLIPDNLKDDFEYILEPYNLKKVFQRQDRRLEEERPAGERKARREALTTYLKALIGKPDELVRIMTYPTIWQHHAEQLEKLDVDVRVKITEIISSYLTGDEYLVLELLPKFKKRPSPEEAVQAYRGDEGAMGESTYSKVCRFLSTASEMAKENLDLLAEEMHYRYNRNKASVEKIIVETVDGGDDAQEKIRTVTAFRTPFPPYILVSTSVLAEGVDLHTECNRIVHYDHEWNPASLEQKTGRVDRVGSKSERTSKKIQIAFPYIKHTQDEKAYRVVMARKSWFDTIMGENYEAKWNRPSDETESLHELPERIKTDLKMNLDNDAHLKKTG